jgi:hypothetical protein
MRKSHLGRWLLYTLLSGVAIAVVLAALLAVELYAPFRPTAAEVVQYYEHQRMYVAPPPNIPMPSPPVALRVEPLGPWQVVLGRNDQGDGRICLQIAFVTKRRLTGIHHQGGSGNCFDPLSEVNPIELVSFYHGGYVAQAGIVTDPEILGLQMNWEDGTASTLPTEGTFLATRQDGVRLISMLGLNADGAVVEGSLVRDRTLQLENAAATRRAAVEGGFVDVGVYVQSNQGDQQCLRVSFTTVKTLTSSLTGEIYLSEQIVCGELAAWQSGLFASTVLDGNATVAGYTADAAVSSVTVLWSDGVAQGVPAMDGIYVAHRVGSVLQVTAVLWQTQ